MAKNFAMIGCGGFIAPRHLQAIKDTGNNLIAAVDKSDSVGILDKYFEDVNFFTEFERFDRHAEKLRRQPNVKIHFVSICSPNYLHDAHIRFAFRIGADAICEKPTVLNPWNLDALEKLEKETGRRVFSILQLRCHAVLKKLKEKIENENRQNKYDIELTYITPRGKWYERSWKGEVEKSGGLATNLGVHFFDMLIWIFGNVKNYEVHYSDKKRMGGYLELEKANVRWFLSTEKKDIPLEAKKNGENSAYRSILIDGEEIEFSEGFTNLHTEMYKQTLDGKGFGIREVRPAIELVYKIRNAIPKINDRNKIHKLLIDKVEHENEMNVNKSNYYAHPSSEIEAEIGEGTKIWHFSHVLKGSKIGKNCIIGQNVMIGPDAVIGDRCKIQNNVSVYKGVILEDDVFCGPSMVFTNVLNPRAFVERKNEFVNTLVKKGATIGANATIVGDVTIGEYALIGAGAVVTKDIPDYALILGLPGKQEGWVCKCGEVLTREIYSDEKKILECKRCQEKYEHFQDYLKPLKKIGGG